MDAIDLHKILDDENRKLSLDELKQVIYELKQDAYIKLNHTIYYDSEKDGFYKGEQNAFQICLDLLEHLGEKQVCNTND